MCFEAVNMLTGWSMTIMPHERTDKHEGWNSCVDDLFYQTDP